MSSAAAVALVAIACAACRDRPSVPQRVAVHNAPAVVDAAGPDATAHGVPLPAQVAEPMPPWPHHRDPSCPGYVAVSTVDLVSCAVCNDGAVHCWGETSSRVLAGRTSHSPSDVARIDGIADAVAVAVSTHVACTLDRASRVRCWGDRGSAGSDAAHDEGARPPPVAPIIDVALPDAAIAIEVGDLHACALLATQSIACWGLNDWGQLGVDVVGSGAGHTVAPTVIPGLDATRISAAGNVTCAVDTAHRAWCWGWSDSGATGAGDRRHRIGSVRVGRLDDVTEISTDGQQGCLRRANDDVWCWGQPDLLAKTTPAPALRTRLPPGRSLAIDGDTISAIGNEGVVTLATGATPPKAMAGLPAVRALSRRDDGACAILTTGELRCWGNNRRAELVIEAEPEAR